MKRERACKGCDGSGYVHRPDFFSDLPHTDHAATCWCGATECESCEGTGRVTDHIPAADAVADAETLRLNAPEGSILAVTMDEAATRPLDFPRSAATLAFCVVQLRD